MIGMPARGAMVCTGSLAGSPVPSMFSESMPTQATPASTEALGRRMR